MSRPLTSPIDSLFGVGWLLACFKGEEEISTFTVVPFGGDETVTLLQLLGPGRCEDCVEVSCATATWIFISGPIVAEAVVTPTVVVVLVVVACSVHELAARMND